jgi:hypothetical protein
LTSRGSRKALRRRGQLDRRRWHGTREGDESDVRRADAETGEVLERLEMPPRVAVTGLESDGRHRFFYGGGSSGKVGAVRWLRRGFNPTAFPSTILLVWLSQR